MGYDCNPGYARAKCIMRSDYNPVHYVTDDIYVKNETTNEDNANNNCPCIEDFQNFDSLGIEYDKKLNNLTSNILLGENNSSNNSLMRNEKRDISRFNIQPQTSPIIQQIMNKINQLSDEEKAILFNNIQNGNNNISLERRNQIINRLKQMTPEQKSQLIENIKNRISQMSDEEKTTLLNKIQNTRNNLSSEQKNKIKENIKNKFSQLSDEEKAILLNKIESRKTNISPEQKIKIEQNIKNRVKNMTPEERRQMGEKLNNRLSQVSD